MKPLMSPRPGADRGAHDRRREADEQRHRQPEQQPLHEVPALRVRARQAVDRAAHDRAHLRDRIGRVRDRDAHLDPVVAVQRREAAAPVRHAEQRRFRPPLDVRRGPASRPYASTSIFADGLRGGRLRAQQHPRGLVRVAHVRRLLARPRPAHRVPVERHLVAVRAAPAPPRTTAAGRCSAPRPCGTRGTWAARPPCS